MDLNYLRNEVLPEISADLNARFPFAHILVMDRIAQGTDVTKRGVKHTDGELIPGWNMNARGAVVSVYNGDGLQEVHTSDVSADGIRNAARRVAEGLIPKDPTIPYQIPEFQRVERYVSPRQVDARQVPIRERVAKLVDLENRARAQAGEHDIALQIRYHQLHTTELFVGPHLNGLQELSAVRVQVNYTFDENGQRHPHNLRPGGGGFEVSDISDQALEEAVRFGIAKCYAVCLPEGVSDAIGGPMYGGVVVHEAGGHGLEGDTIAQLIAASRHTQGKEVASRYITVVSDPTKPGFGNYCFDHEGMRGQRAVLIDRGIQTHDVINDFMTATMAGQKPTGHGRRQSPFHGLHSRQSYTGFEGLNPGDEGHMPFDEMVQSMRNGVVIRGISGGMEDPHGGNVQIDAAFGEIISNGKLTGKVCLAPKLQETVTSLYSKVTGVSEIGPVFSGSCGKWHGGWVTVDAASPYLLFTNVKVIGR